MLIGLPALAYTVYLLYTGVPVMMGVTPGARLSVRQRGAGRGTGDAGRGAGAPRPSCGAWALDRTVASG
ncbi:MAG: hypothetical protein MZV65_13115 [Chromatiales bacterium]|nr:hypothetical protein [Chromatiales bacterium]